MATGDAIIFLHADTLLPPGGARAAAQALQRADFGGFSLRFAERALVFSAIASGKIGGLTCRHLRAPLGRVEFR